MSISLQNIIDISPPVHEGVPVWPGSSGITLKWNLRVDRGDDANLTRLDMDVHIGTHVESPLHSFFPAESIDQVPLETLIGPAVVVDCVNAEVISRAVLESLRLPSGIERLLLKTTNSNFDSTAQFQEHFVGLVPDGAQWIVEQGIKLVGIDYLSIARFGDGPAVHEILFNGGATVIEGLRLTDAMAGRYRLICLPMKLIGTEASPARAILEPDASLV